MSERTPAKTFATVCMEASGAERDRMTAAEICIDEMLTLLDRRDGQADPIYSTLRKLSQQIHRTSTRTENLSDRHQRLIRVRQALTKAFPLTDEDIEASPARIPVERDQLTSKINHQGGK